MAGEVGVHGFIKKLEQTSALLDTRGGGGPEAFAPASADFAARALRDAGAAPDDSCWLALYHRTCERRRAARLQPYRPQLGHVAAGLDIDGSDA